MVALKKSISKFGKSWHNYVSTGNANNSDFVTYHSAQINVSSIVNSFKKEKEKDAHTPSFEHVRLLTQLRVTCIN